MSECCAICLDAMDSGQAFTTVCAHTFHERCIQTLCARGERRAAGAADTFACPFCRTANTYRWAGAAAVLCRLCDEALEPTGEDTYEDTYEMGSCDCIFHALCLSRHALQATLRRNGGTSQEHARIYNDFQGGCNITVECPGCGQSNCCSGIYGETHVAQYQPTYRLDIRLRELKREFAVFRISWGRHVAPEFMEAAEGTIQSMRHRMQHEALSTDELREFGERIDDLRTSFATARASQARFAQFSPARAAASFDPTAQAWCPSLRGEELEAFLQQLREERQGGGV